MTYTIRNTVASSLAALALAAMPGCTTTDTSEYAAVYCKWMCFGEDPTVVSPGTTKFLVPFQNDVYKLNTEMQTFYMTLDHKSNSRDDDDEPVRKGRDDLVFKTKEGNNIGQDVVVTWKLDPGKADVIVKYVGTDLFEIEEKYVRPLARSIVRDEFNHLESQQFYESKERFKAAQDAHRILTGVFADYGIIITGVEPRDYRFEDGDYQKAINDAKNAGQDFERANLEIESKKEFWKKKFQEQVGISNDVIAKAEGNKRSVVNQADAQYEKAKNESEAITAEYKAKSEAITIMRKAMASQGGNVAVMMEYTKHFNPEEIVVMPCEEGNGGLSLNYLNLNQLLQNGLKQ